jgi:hypothetical protein
MTGQTIQSRMAIVHVLNTILLIILITMALVVVGMIIFAAMAQFGSGALPAPLTIEGSGDVPTRQQVAIGAIISAIIAGAYFYIAKVVRGIVQTTLKGDPFVEANISRLRKTWIVLALLEIFRMFFVRSIPFMPKGDTAIESVTVETNLSAWFLVFVIAAMAEVFRIGLELRRDQELTV